MNDNPRSLRQADMTERRGALLETLACPVCSCRLNLADGSLRCERDHEFPVVGEVPMLLVDVKDRRQLEAHESASIDREWMLSYLSTELPTLKQDLKGIKTKLEDALVLDLGCGPLFPTAYLRLLFRPKGVVGVDFSYRQIKEGGDAVLQALKMDDRGMLRVVVDLNLDRLPFNDSSFDVVCARHFLHHLRRHDSILKEIRRVLRPNGYCWFLDPCEPYIPMFKWNSPLRVPLGRILQFLLVNRDPPTPKHLVDEAQHLRSFDRPKHYFAWKNAFARFFDIEYFGYAPSTDFIIKNIRTVREMSKSARRLLAQLQFYVRILLEYPSVVSILRKKESVRDAT